ncbi:MAG: helix-turn-helix domain-containing protein [Victivallaceae bacterium]
MRPRIKFSEAQLSEVKKFLHNTTTKEGYQRVQAVWLRMKLGLHAAEIAQILGIHEASVWRIHSRYFKYGAKIFEKGLSGGRWHENLSTEEEAAFLEPYSKQAESSGMIVVTEVASGYEKLIGRSVPKSTVYRLLDRHGWRKITPRPSHPKADPAVQDAFKKTSVKS